MPTFLKIGPPILPRYASLLSSSVSHEREESLLFLSSDDIWMRVLLKGRGEKVPLWRGLSRERKQERHKDEGGTWPKDSKGLIAAPLPLAPHNPSPQIVVVIRFISRGCVHVCHPHLETTKNKGSCLWLFLLRKWSIVSVSCFSIQLNPSTPFQSALMFYHVWLAVNVKNWGRAPSLSATFPWLKSVFHLRVSAGSPAYTLSRENVNFSSLPPKYGTKPTWNILWPANFLSLKRDIKYSLFARPFASCSKQKGPIIILESEMRSHFDLMASFLW